MCEREGEGEWRGNHELITTASSESATATTVRYGTDDMYPIFAVISRGFERNPDNFGLLKYMTTLWNGYSTCNGYSDTLEDKD